ncbi:virulence factor Mce family protein [Mycobacterium vicinigordonae]|uniref:Virulence factor Mce family protein n=1 Tax=Mycobacterium vicinigordonae TaxID=1719132 RepID=A0A7D6HMZ5_9MYCO|nr:virulence factor Mce family protein [Mycobacterium vicinigordonae]QLL06251.1 virulence factor Mce family protein [Mycobacterium vicinigordonae]
MTGMRRVLANALLVIAACGLPGCANWRGVNSLPLPGTEGRGPGAFTIQAQLPDVDHLEQNSRVRVNDVTVGNVTKVERQGWHALVTMRLNGDVHLPANSTATVGQTSLLGSLHVELAPPKNVSPQGSLHEGSLIPLSSGSLYPTTEQTLAATSMLLNGGGIGQLDEIVQVLSSSFAGREEQLHGLIRELDKFVGNLNRQTDDIIAATDSLNNLAGQFADQRPVVDKALKTLPNALKVLRDQRQNLAEALDEFGKFGALTADSVSRIKKNVVEELKQLGPVLQSLADAGPALTRSLSFFSTFPFPNDTLLNWFRGDYANLTAIIDLTLSRIDSSFFTGTRFEGNLTELELQWGRTIGQLPSPYTAGNPLVAPYRWDQGS